MHTKTFSIAVFLIIAIFLSNQSCFSQTDFQLRSKLVKNEKTHPTEHLVIRNFTSVPNMVITQKPDLFHHTIQHQDGWNIGGFFRNTATFASYKDILVEVKFFTKTGTLLGSQNVVFYELFSPHCNIQFQYKLNPPNGTEDFAIRIIKATPI